MENSLETATKVLLLKPEREELLAHCFRKMNAKYLANETPERKAYGLIAGNIEGDIVKIKSVCPLHVNFRNDNSNNKYMNNMMDQHAEASETPLDKRGWVASPIETKNMLNRCVTEGTELLASYHMHRVAWDHDHLRDLPTELDYLLAKDTGMLMFIISTVNDKKPTIKAFYEGHPEKQLQIIGEL